LATLGSSTHLTGVTDGTHLLGPLTGQVLTSTGRVGQSHGLALCGYGLALCLTTRLNGLGTDLTHGRAVAVRDGTRLTAIRFSSGLRTSTLGAAQLGTALGDLLHLKLALLLGPH
jgi:hypothetical protein